jgi:hypothetical protein
VFSLAMLAWIAFERLLGFHDELIAYQAAFSPLFALIAILVYVLAMRQRRLKPDAAPGWFPAFAFGMRMAVVVAVLSPAVQWLIHTVVSPDYFATIQAYAVAENVMTEAAAAAQFNLGSYIVQGVIGALVMGAITSAIVAIFQRKTQEAA